ncbi:AMP-binding protein [Aurantimonas marianensis]|uniref:AMP-binding protein n=1 Tax=Aurantimonas marianensis TaxID=2920428 RepID=A0A9X2KHW1_9HYPH|nr:AMP-binding protein [Aurantimonas marianensis]MCP3055002.1 AMP-binding protein [Aurantimonas marianensis]
MGRPEAGFTELSDTFSETRFEEDGGAVVGFASLQALASSATAAAFAAQEARGHRLEPGARVLLSGDTGLPLLWKIFGLWDVGAVPLIAPTSASPISAALTDQIDWRWNGERRVLLGEHASRIRPKDPDPAAIIHLTSGSTGAPKLAPRSIKSLLDEAARYRARYGLRAGEHALVAAPIGHSFGFGALLGLAASGATIAVPPVFNARRLARALLAGRYAAVILTAPMARLLVAAARRIDLPAISGLGLAIAGAGPVSDALSDDFVAAFGCPLGRNYGCSETGATFGEAEALPEGVIGRPFDGVRVLSPLTNQTAELVLDLGHAVLANREPPLSIWRSGDNAYRLPDGTIRLLGRRDARLKVNGRSIDGDRLANAARAAPGVTDAVTLVLQAPSAPDRDYLVLVCEGDGIAPDQLAATIAEGGGPMPHKIATLKRFPRTAAGKPDRAALGAAVISGKARRIACPAWIK